jgi:hypothetical protein
MKRSRATLVDAFWAADELDHVCGMPLALRSRTIHLLALAAATLSIGAAIEWPRVWQLVALADLAATSILFALAAVREWRLRAESRPPMHWSWSNAQRVAAWHGRPLLENQARSR